MMKSASGVSQLAEAVRSREPLAAVAPSATHRVAKPRAA